MKQISSRRMTLAVISLLFCAQSAFGMLSRFARIAGMQGLRSLTVSSPVKNPTLMRAYVAYAPRMQCNQCVNQQPHRAFSQNQHMPIKMKLSLLAHRVRTKIIGPCIVTPNSSKIDFVVSEDDIAAAQKSELRSEQLLCLAWMKDLVKERIADEKHWQHIFSIAENLIKHENSFKQDFIAMFTDAISLLHHAEREKYIKLLEASVLNITRDVLNDHFVNTCLQVIKRCALNPKLFQEAKSIVGNVASLIHELSNTHSDLVQKILKIIVLNTSEESRDECLNSLVKLGTLKMDVQEQLLLMRYLREKEHREFQEHMRAYEQEIKKLRSEVEDARSSASSASTFAMLSFFNSELNS